MAGWLSLEQALEQALSHVTPISRTELVTLPDCYGRTLAEDVVAPIDVPPWDNSAMDGYAVQYSDLATLTVTQTVKAGEQSEQAVTVNECARIMTGAPIPPGADTVVIQENTQRDGDTITLTASPQKGANIRLAASDIATGDVLFKAGHRLTAQDLMLLSSIGVSQALVFTKPKVAIVATGDELAAPDTQKQPHQIYESHRAGLKARLIELGCSVIDAGIVPDQPERITNTFQELASDCDLVISSGGVSVGDADWVKPALSKMGTLHLWKLAIKPGKPFAFGQFKHCYFCGLPGNPVSAFVTFDQLVIPIVKKLRGDQRAHQRLTLKATLANDVRRRAGRKEFARGVFSQDESGQLRVTVLAKQSSSVMTSLTQANCYVVIDAECSGLHAGEMVDIQPFSIEC